MPVACNRNLCADNGFAEFCHSDTSITKCATREGDVDLRKGVALMYKGRGDPVTDPS